MRNFADEVLIKKPEFQCFKMASENKVKEAHLALADLNQWREQTKVEMIDVIGSLRTKLDRSEVKRFESLVKILPTMEQFTSENKRLEDKMDSFRLTVDQALDTIVAYNQILRRQDEILCEKAQKHEMNQLQKHVELKLAEMTEEIEKAIIMNKEAHYMLSGCQIEQAHTKDAIAAMKQRQKEVLFL